MSITMFLEEEQIELLGKYNQDKSSPEIVPLVPRNLNSGWPLLQVSLFSITERDDTEEYTELYEPAIGGGKCHSISISGFALACLISKIPGTLEITTVNLRKRKTRESIRIEHIQSFLHEYRVVHKQLGISIASRSNGYGRELIVELPEMDASRLVHALLRAFHFSLKEEQHDVILDLAGWETIGYTADEIQQAINDSVAIFTSGQIFLDLGALLEQQVADPEITRHFATIFKVDEFLSIMASQQSKKAAVVRKSLYDEMELTGTEEIHHLRRSIAKLSAFVIRIAENHPEQSTATHALAQELTQHLDTFMLEFSRKKQLFPALVLQFKQNVDAYLHRNDKLLSEYKASYPAILTDIQIALTELEVLSTCVKMDSARTPVKGASFFTQREPHEPLPKAITMINSMHKR